MKLDPNDTRKRVYKLKSVEHVVKELLRSPLGFIFSATFRSEAKEKFKVNLKSVYLRNKVINQDT